MSANRWAVRNYSQDIEISAAAVNRGNVTPLPPLSEAMPNLPPVIYSSAVTDDALTEVTVLSNGLRVASEKKFGQFCTAGGKYINLICLRIKIHLMFHCINVTLHHCFSGH